MMVGTKMTTLRRSTIFGLGDEAFRLMKDYTHLGSEAQAIIGTSAEERITWVLQDRWIGYTKAQDALDRLDRLLHHPRTNRMPNLLLLGHTNNGKTTVIRHFADLHPPDDNPGGDTLHYPVMMIQMP